MRSRFERKGQNHETHGNGHCSEHRFGGRCFHRMRKRIRIIFVGSFIGERAKRCKLCECDGEYHDDRELFG